MIKKDKILLDTSIQIGRLKYKEIDDFIRKSGSKYQVYSSNYVLFEFKVGLIKTLIEYWQIVNICSNVAEAQVKWSERFSIREAKIFGILQSLITKHLGSSNSNKKKYLRQVESIISIVLSSFMMGIEKKLIGDFSTDEIVNFSINSKNDYYDFLKKCEEKKEMIDQTLFWQKYATELDKLLLSIELQKKYESVHTALGQIKNDIKYAHMFNTNKKLGDCVISIDSPQKVTILATDNSFKVIGDSIGRKYIIIPNQYP